MDDTTRYYLKTSNRLFGNHIIKGTYTRLLQPNSRVQFPPIPRLQPLPRNAIPFTQTLTPPCLSPPLQSQTSDQTQRMEPINTSVQRVEPINTSIQRVEPVVITASPSLIEHIDNQPLNLSSLLTLPVPTPVKPLLIPPPVPILSSIPILRRIRSLRPRTTNNRAFTRTRNVYQTNCTKFCALALQQLRHQALAALDPESQ